MTSNEPPVVTVSQVNRVIGLLIKNDKRLLNVAVRGEISNFTRHYKTGHLYFTLKDEQTQLKAVMFAGNALKLNFSPKDGDSVICLGSITVYEPAGVYQINCIDIRPYGKGEQAADLEKLKKRLSDEGIFSQKRSIPAMPKKIAVVTSAGAAALRDIINIVSRRCPTVTLSIAPAQVQGADAPRSIVSALKRAQESGADTIIFGRGGGSAEDLSAFNTEMVARAVYGSKIPTISAVGHETDFTIADMAADLRAPTPSAAAELAVPDIYAVYAGIEQTLQRLNGILVRRFAFEERRLLARAEVINALSPLRRLENSRQRLGMLSENIRFSMISRLEKEERALLKNAEIISALNPMGVLARGYSAVYKDGKVLSDSAELSVGDSVKAVLARGGFIAEVTKIEE